MTRLLLAVISLGLIACSSAKKGDAEPKPGSHAQAINAMLDAVNRGDCKAFEASIGGDLAARVKKSGCAKGLEELRELNIEVAEVISSKQDGRKGHGYIVRVRVSTGAHGQTKEKQTIFRVKAIKGKWVVVNI